MPSLPTKTPQHISYTIILIWPLLILLLHVIVTLLNLYTFWWWLDSPMHFLGGASIALGSYFFIKRNQQSRKNTLAPLFSVFHIILITFIIAIGWEFFEMAHDIFLQTKMQPSHFDTIKDLALGLTGSIITFIILKIKKPL